MNKQAASGLAIAGFVTLLISFPIPIYGLYVGGIALALVAFAGFLGERTFVIVTVILSGVKVWFLSPTFAILTRDGSSDAATITAIAVIAHAVPLVAIYLGAKNKDRPKEKQGSSDE